MARPISPLTLAALALVAKGVPPYRAALMAGVGPNTVYRALARARKAGVGKPAMVSAPV